MKKALLVVLLILVLVGALVVTSFIALRPGMTRQDIEARLKPSRFSPAGSYLFHNDRLGIFTARRNFLVATQQVTIRISADGTATNVQSRWSWRTSF